MDAFENLEIWKRSSRLSIDLYMALLSYRESGLKNQITSSALSVPTSIAEGYERDSVNEYIRFLRIAKGCCGELRTQLYIGREAGILDRQTASKFMLEASEISCMLNGLVSSLRGQEQQPG